MKGSNIPVPPKFGSGDFKKASYWKLRGKLDAPKERWISYPGAERDGDTSSEIAWAGCDHLDQAKAPPLGRSWPDYAIVKESLNSEALGDTRVFDPAAILNLLSRVSAGYDSVIDRMNLVSNWTTQVLLRRFQWHGFRFLPAEDQLSQSLLRANRSEHLPIVRTPLFLGILNMPLPLPKQSGFVPL